MTSLEYERDGAAIYRASFATIRAEADLERFGDPALAAVVVRMIHACGRVELASSVAASDGVVGAARSALADGAPLLCDSTMVATGITRRRLPAANDIVCTIHESGIADDARSTSTTRASAAVDRWVPRLGGAVAVIGNAPTALFRLIEIVLSGGPRPAAIVGVPVGFVGAAESKQALATFPHGVPWLTVHGREGGSAIAVAAVNAIAHPDEGIVGGST